MKRKIVPEHLKTVATLKKGTQAISTMTLSREETTDEHNEHDTIQTAKLITTEC